LSIALIGGLGLGRRRGAGAFSLFGVLLLEVIDEFAGLVFGVGDTEFELAFLGPQDDRLAFQAADHVEGRPRLAAQRQFQEVFLDARLQGLLEIALDLEEPVGRADAADPLVGPAVVVVGDPEFDALAGGLETVELGPSQELAPEGGPEALDLAQRHGVMRAALDVADAVLLELRLEPAGAAPGGVLAAVVGEHLLGRLILADGHPVDLDHRRRRGAAEQVRPHHEPGVVVQEPNEVGVAPAQPEGEDVRLPHLVGRGPLEEAGPREVLGPGRLGGGHEPLPVQPLAHRLRTGRQQEHPAQELGDPLGPKSWVLLLQPDDLLRHRRRQLVLARSWGRARPQEPCLPLGPILVNPPDQRRPTGPDFLRHQAAAKAVFQNQPDGLNLLLG
jgi:hypothetical protein